jgi:GntR family transcriptional regulator
MEGAMQIQIDNASDRPVYQQIVDQVKRDIALGKLVKDDRLPTVRDLAAQLVINPNTIAKAFRQLEQEGVIVTRAGAGAFVANLQTTLSQDACRKIVTDQLERAIIDAIHLQIDKSTLRDWFEKGLEKFKFSENRGNDHE